jgi:hypothetical protein
MLLLLFSHPGYMSASDRSPVMHAGMLRIACRGSVGSSCKSSWLNRIPEVY